MQCSVRFWRPTSGLVRAGAWPWCPSLTVCQCKNAENLPSCVFSHTMYKARYLCKSCQLRGAASHGGKHSPWRRTPKNPSLCLVILSFSVTLRNLCYLCVSPLAIELKVCFVIYSATELSRILCVFQNADRHFLELPGLQQLFLQTQLFYQSYLSGLTSAQPQCLVLLFGC